MKIRSVTCFYNPASPTAGSDLDNLGRLAKSARSNFKKSGFIVQSCRLATVPFPYYLDLSDQSALLTRVRHMESEAEKHNFEYLSLGPALVEFPESYKIIPKILEATNMVFCGGVIANRSREISLPSVYASAKVIAENSIFESNGFGNLRFAALANVPPYSPFFPAAYSSGRESSFALAIECADLAVTAFKNASNLKEARHNLINSLEQRSNDMKEIADQLAHDFNVNFKGYDFSLAPFPEDNVSLGGALERLGITSLGQYGSIVAAAFVAEALDHGNWPRCGFNGLMLPVLEDSVLARRTIDGTLTVKDLLVYSAVCGTGLDTVPLPGNATPGKLAALLLDLAALATRLDKPLTARLMPIPGKSAGDMTDFSFDFFANGRVMEFPGEPMHGFFTGDEVFTINPRPK